PSSSPAAEAPRPADPAWFPHPPIHQSVGPPSVPRHKIPSALQRMPQGADGRTMAISVVIADDHSLVRQGLRRYLEMAGDIEVLGEAANGAEVLRMIENGTGEPDIVLLDIRMPEMDGLETARRIRVRHPNVGIIILT